MNVFSKFGETLHSVDAHALLKSIGLEQMMSDAPTDHKYLAYLSGGILASAAVLFVGNRLFHDRLSSWNLPGPKSSLLPIDLFKGHKNQHQLHLLLDDYVKTYGETFAFNYKGQPVVATTDEDIIHKILWKEFPNFENRKFFVEMPWPCQHMVTMAKGAKAKMIRNLLKAVLDAKSIKNNWAHFQEANQDVEELLRDAALNMLEVNSTSLANGYIMQIITKMAFSLDCSNQSDLNKQLVQLSHLFTRPPTWLQSCSSLPIIGNLLKLSPWGFNSSLHQFIKIATDIVVERRKEKNREPQDVLDVLLAAQSKDSNISTEILLAQAIVLLTVVHASTATTISIATYYIAKHKDVQRRLQQEIDSISMEDGFPSWEHLHKQLPYLGQVVNETLRLYPSAFMLMRECTKPTTVNGISFEKGDGVLIPTYSMHRDPKVFTDPEQFNPDRFETKPSRHYYPFGDGYRMCPGKEMALSEIKTYLASMLKNFDLSLVDENQELCVKSYISAQTTMAVDEPIQIRVQKRRH
eukprot:TCONS_00010304-protein